MDDREYRIKQAIDQTQVVRVPRQHLATFGVTNVPYYVVTEPAYRELAEGEQETVIRQGKVIAERPEVVTPNYMLHLEGFGEDARKYMESLGHQYGVHSPGLLYRYRNESGTLNIVGGEVQVVAQRINDDLDHKEDHGAVVIQGVDELWDVSLMKFIHDYTVASLTGNIAELRAGGALEADPGSGVPRAAIQRVEQLFYEVEHGADPTLLKQELDRWELFHRYEDRFLSLFRRKR